MHNNDSLTNIVKRLITTLASLFEINLTLLAYRENGILNSGSITKTGEQFVIDNVLPSLIKKTSPILFDIGGDTGESTKELAQKFPLGIIFVFEPNLIGFKLLKKNLRQYSNVVFENIGLGVKREKSKLYRYKKFKTGLVTSSKVGLHELYKIDSPIEEIDYVIETIDSYCTNHKIGKIDFLKIDVEGKELDILKGAKSMLHRGKIITVQFEFNNFNVINRVFLRDFYKTLPNFNFYRLTNRKMLPLGDYDSINEIFKYQNILAIQKAYDIPTV